MTITNLLKMPEGKTLEFKENILSKDKILATLIAFANTAGGKLIIGIQDRTKHIVGIKDPYSLEETLSTLISDTISPRLIPTIEILPWRETHIIIIDVPVSGTRPHYLTNKGLEQSTYVRVGSTNRLADHPLIESIKRTINAKTFDEEPMLIATATDINFKDIQKIYGPTRVISQDDLQTLHVMTKEQGQLVPTVGGILLFCANRQAYFPDSWIQAGRFQGTNKARILDTIDIKALLPETIQECLLFIRKHISVGLTINDIKSSENWEIPRDALREALINAIVHTDYSLSGSPIRISIFDDRIEIQNPGLLLPGLTIEDITSGLSKVRNRVIARVFRDLKMIEQWGSGIQRIIIACQEAGLSPPKFEEIGYNFRVTLYTTRLKVVSLDESELKILDLLEKFGPLSTQEISDQMDLTPRTIRLRLIKLIGKGKVIEISSGPNDPQKKYVRVS